jgi:hypothetical protein
MKGCEMMTEAEKMIVIKEALHIACRTIRENPFSSDWYFEDTSRMRLLVNGTNRDPAGEEYVNYFIVQAYQKLVEMGVLRDE